MGEPGRGGRGRTQQRRAGRRRAARRRLLVAPAMAAGLAVALTGCLLGPVVGPVTRPDTGRDDRGVSHHGPTPTALSVEDGVEVWDLTVPPTVEAFGMDAGPVTPHLFVGAYSSSVRAPRPARFLLPGGASVDLAVHEVIFTGDTVSPDEPASPGDSEPGTRERAAPGRYFSLSVLAPGGRGDAAGVASYRDLLRQLDLPDDSARQLEDALAHPEPVDPLGPTVLVGTGADVPGTDAVAFGVGTSVDPTGELRSFTLRFSAVWEVVPLP